MVEGPDDVPTTSTPNWPATLEPSPCGSPLPRMASTCSRVISLVILSKFSLVTLLLPQPVSRQQSTKRRVILTRRASVRVGSMDRDLRIGEWDIVASFEA